MKIFVGNGAENARTLTLFIRNLQSGQDISNTTLSPGGSQDIEIPEGASLVATFGTSVFADASFEAPIPVGTAGETAVITPDASAPSGSPEEIASRTDDTGAPAPVPSYLGTATAADREALAAAGMDPADAHPLSTIGGQAAMGTTDAPAEALPPAGGGDGLSTVQPGPAAGSAIDPDPMSGFDSSGNPPPPETVQGGAGEDSVSTDGGQSADTLAGGQSSEPAPEEASTSAGGASEDSLAGGQSTETTMSTGASEDTIVAGAGTDTVTPRDPTDEEVAEAVRVSAADKGLEDGLLKEVRHYEVNQILAQKGLAAVDSERANAVQVAMEDSSVTE